MYVERIPRFLQSAFSKYSCQFSRIGFNHFRVLIVALVINARKGKLVHFAGAAPKTRASHVACKILDFRMGGSGGYSFWGLEYDSVDEATGWRIDLPDDR